MSDCRHTSGSRELAVLLASGVVISGAWALFPSTVERGIHVPLPAVSPHLAIGVDTARNGGSGDSIRPDGLVRLQLVQMKATSRQVAAAPAARSDSYPNMVTPVSEVPAKVRLQVLLALLRMQVDPVHLPALEAKLQRLLKLPDFVLQRVLEHPDLADFNTLLHAVFLGDADLWWVEEQLGRIDVVPMTNRSARIDVNGEPAFVFEPAPAAPGNTGGQQAGTLRALPQPTPSAPQEPAAVTMSVENADMTTYAAASVPSDVPVEQFSASAPADGVPQAASVPVEPAPPGPASSPAPSSGSTSRIGGLARGVITGVSRLASSIFRTGNKFEPGTQVSEPSNNSSGTETATPSTASPAGEAGPDADPPSGSGNDDGASSGADSPSP